MSDLEALVTVPRVALGVVLGAWWLLRSWRAAHARDTARRMQLDTRTRYAHAAHKNAGACSAACARLPLLTVRVQMRQWLACGVQLMVRCARRRN